MEQMILSARALASSVHLVWRVIDSVSWIDEKKKVVWKSTLSVYITIVTK